MITLHVLNVGRGASILIELPSTGDEKRIGIVDCFRGAFPAGSLTRRLEAFAQKQPLSIEFLVITHLHADHMLGIGRLLKDYQGVIRKYADSGVSGDDVIPIEYPGKTRLETEARKDLREISRFKETNPARINVLTNVGVRVYEDEENELTVQSVAPPGKFLDDFLRDMRRYLERLRERWQRTGSYPVDWQDKALRTYNLNKTSSAIEIRVGKKTVLLGGDVLRRAWKLVLAGDPPMLTPPDVFVLSHHGAADGFPKSAWDLLGERCRHAIVTGRGRGQPSPAVTSVLHETGTAIWATNRPSSSRPADATTYVTQVHYGVPARREAADVVVKVGATIEVAGLKFAGRPSGPSIAPSTQGSQPLDSPQ